MGGPTFKRIVGLGGSRGASQYVIRRISKRLWRGRADMSQTEADRDRTIQEVCVTLP